jgi:hypothetical protein
LHAEILLTARNHLSLGGVLIEVKSALSFGIAGLVFAITGCGANGTSAGATDAAYVSAAAKPSGPYLAESQDIKLTRFYKPACRSGCMISGDSTAALYHMTWSSWGHVAIGRGSYHLDGCEPNCATGKIYKVPVIVKLENPVKACYKGKEYFYSRAVFSFPKGLPKALQGSNAPVNPWTFTSVINEARQSCRA